MAQLPLGSQISIFERGVSVLLGCLPHRPNLWLDVVIQCQVCQRLRRPFCKASSGSTNWFVDNLSPCVLFHPLCVVRLASTCSPCGCLLSAAPAALSTEARHIWWCWLQLLHCVGDLVLPIAHTRLAGHFPRPVVGCACLLGLMSDIRAAGHMTVTVHFLTAI